VHPAEEYIAGVLSGEIAACRWVRLAYAADVDGDDYFFALDLFGFECD